MTNSADTPTGVPITGPKPAFAWLMPLLVLPGMLLLTVQAQVASRSLRPDAVGRNGMVATANPLATLAGQKMLVEGGNAFDAIVAAAAALNAAEPYMSGTGGVGYMLVYSARENRVRWRDEMRSVPAQNILMETRVPQAVRDQLSSMGFRLNTSIGEWSMSVGGVQAIIINRESGWIHGGADPRRNGYAMGW